MQTGRMRFPEDPGGAGRPDAATSWLRLTGVGHGLVAHWRDLGNSHACPRLQELLEVGDVVGLDDEVERVLWKGQPETVDLHVFGLTVEERARPALPHRTVLRCVRLLDVKEHVTFLLFRADLRDRLANLHRARDIGPRLVHPRRRGFALSRIERSWTRGLGWP